MRRLLAVTLVLAGLPATAPAHATDDEVLQRVHGRIIATDLAGPSCWDVMSGAPEPGVASIGFEYRLVGTHRGAGGRYGGKVVFALGEVVISMPGLISWPHMAAADHERAERLKRAIYHHEVGHVRIAEAARDALNDHDALEAPDPFALRAAADAFGREGFERFKHDERAYDELTSHGRKQHVAPGALAGPDTAIDCG